jgi:ribonuclease HIII
MTSSNLQQQVFVDFKAKMNPSQIGWLFVQQYYTFLNESPERLYLFYNTNSIFTHGKEGENVINVVGQQVLAI